MRGITIFLVAGIALLAFDHYFHSGRYLAASSKMLRSITGSIGLR